MLTSRSFLALATTAVLTVTTQACVVRWTDGPIEDDDSSFFDDDSSSVSTGVGGDDTTTGTGGDETTTGTGGDETATTGTGGGDPYCLDGVGTGETMAMCDELAISPENFGVCEDGFTALGYAACARSFEIWEDGFAEAFAECLSYIPAEQACEEQPVLDCVDSLYTETCEMPFIQDSCQYWADTCAEGGDDTLDVAQCYSDITPFNDDGILQLTDCMNVVDGTCGERYDYCFEEVTALD